MTGAKEKQFVSTEIKRLCSLGFLQHSATKPHCVLPLQTAPKKSGGFRLITDCRYVNSFLHIPKFSQQGIKDVVTQIEHDDQLQTVDLKDGFFHISVCPAHRTFLGIFWKGLYYVWMCLPFGLGLSPHYFNKVLRAVLTFLREQGLRLALWVDDFLHMSKPPRCADAQDTLLHTLQDLGWYVNWKKSHLQWSHCVMYVGYRVWANYKGCPWIQALPEKIHKLRSVIVRILKCNQPVPARRLASVAGQCVGMIRTFAPGQQLLRNLYRDLATRLAWTDSILLSDATRKDLVWWSFALQGWNGAPLCQRAMDLQLCTDASNTGWGGCTSQSSIPFAAGSWQHGETSLHINTKELLAVYKTLCSLGDRLQGKVVQVLSDNVTTCAYLNRMGGPNIQCNLLL